MSTERPRSDPSNPPPASPERIRVLIADDHTVLRAGLRLLIEAEPDMEVVGEAGNASECVDLARELTPDVVLLDLSMPGGSGAGAIGPLLETSGEVRVLVLTMHADPAYVKLALASGASGYVTKDAPPSEIISAIRSLSGGRTYVAVPMRASRFPSVFGQGRAGPVALPDPARPTLSEREREVIALVVRGFTSKEVAEKLRLSVKTVETYRARCSKKLGLRRRPDLVQYALETGLLGEGERLA